MELTNLQKATKKHVLDVFKKQKCYLIADEVGLGKTIVAGEVISTLAKQKKEKNNEPYIVYYICGNERVTNQNCRKLREICGGMDTADVRLSMQWRSAKTYRDSDGVLILPVTPATTFTNKNSEFNQEERENQEALIRCLKEGDAKESLKRKADSIKSWIKNEKKDAIPREFVEIRQTILLGTIKTILPPDLVLLDEFQNYANLLYGDYQLFQKCLDRAKHVLMLSATPYEMGESEVRMLEPFEDDVELKAEDDEIDPEEEANREFVGHIKPNESYRKLLRFIDHRNGKAERDLTNAENLYNEVFCRSERSMFYNTDKESEIEYVYADAGREKEHLDYTAALYKKYKEAYEEAGIKGFPDNPPNRFLAIVKECPAPASFATRYKSLKNSQEDTKFYQALKQKRKDVFAPPPSNHCPKLDPFRHSSLSLLYDQACPEGIEKLLWIPPSTFQPDGCEQNPFNKYADYTKSLVFGNYRFSTAAPACLLSERIREKQAALIGKANKSSLSDWDGNIDDKNWWMFCHISNICVKNEPSPSTAYNSALDSLRALVKLYLKNNIELIRAVTGEECPQKAVNIYAKWGDLKNVILEYAFLLGLSNPPKEDLDELKGRKCIKKLRDTKAMLDDMRLYFGEECVPAGKRGRQVKLSPTKVICLRDKGDNAKIPDAFQMSCGFVERFTDDNTDTNAHIKRHQQNLQNLFNAPFYPFVICSTSVAQEGLDFHNYCHRIVHWSVAKTPVSYEQREGRIDRYLSHLMRKRIALCDSTGCFEERLNRVIEQQQNVENEGPKPLFPYWYVGEQEYEILTFENELPNNWPNFIRVICALPNSKESDYFSRLRTALRNYNYHIGPTYQKAPDKTNHCFCPLLRENDAKAARGDDPDRKD